MPSVKDINEYLSLIAPLNYKMDFDNVGFLVGCAEAEVSHILISLDITSDVITEALDTGAQLIVSHHPLFFSLKTVTDQDIIGRKIVRMLSGGLSAICMHTNLDAARGGVNDALAAAAGITHEPDEAFEVGIQEDQIIIGQAELFTVNEADPLAINQAYPLASGQANQFTFGQAELLNEDGFLPYGEPFSYGRVGYLKSPCSLPEYLASLKKALGTNGLRYHNAGRDVYKVAVEGGSGGDAFSHAIEKGCDTFITADIKYDVFLEAKELGINLIDGDHYCTENLVTGVLAEKLRGAFPSVNVSISAKHKQTTQFYV